MPRLLVNYKLNMYI